VALQTACQLLVCAQLFCMSIHGLLSVSGALWWLDSTLLAAWHVGSTSVYSWHDVGPSPGQTSCTEHCSSLSSDEFEVYWRV
jgi:hypothetical protein